MSDTTTGNTDRKAAILSRVRRSLKAGDDDSARRDAVRSRISEHRPGIIPQRGQVDREARVALFRSLMERASATVDRIDSIDELPAAVTEYLKSNNLPPSLRMGNDGALNGVDWSSQPMLDVAHGPAEAQDTASVSMAFAAVAESGTLILHSGGDNPTTLNFLPENHIVVLRAADVAGDYETVWAQLRETFGEGTLPRTVNMISGPSRTGDIEQTLLLGAHGPRKLHIVIVD